MTSRPNWLEVFRVKKRTSGKRAKPIYVDSKNNVVKPTHYNLQGGTYYVPKSKESEFLSRYIEFLFGYQNGRLSLTEAPLQTPLGKVFSPVFLDLDLRYPLNSAGQ